MWTKEQIEKHIETCQKLNKIKNEVFDFIRKNKDPVSEYEIQQFILSKFKEYGLKSDKDPPIVAFDENSAIPHYFPKKKSKLLRKNSIILIDIWAKLKNSNFPFADITWMAYYGKTIPKDINEIFVRVIKTRNKTINFIKIKLKKKVIPSGKDISKIAINILNKNNLSNKMNHYLGHSIGFTSPHGNKNGLNSSNKFKLIKNLGYTIEPGIYLKGKFGVRSEIDFYISEDNKVIVTTEMQKEIIKI